jgi:hypothetical protein
MGKTYFTLSTHATNCFKSQKSLFIRRFLLFLWWKDPRGTQVVYILVLLSLPLLLLGLARVNRTSFIISINGTCAEKLLSFPM